MPWDGQGSSDHKPKYQHIPIRPLEQVAMRGREVDRCKDKDGDAQKVTCDAFPTVHPSLCPPVEDGPDASAVRAVPVHVEPGGQEDPVFHGYGAVGEGGD